MSIPIYVHIHMYTYLCIKCIDMYLHAFLHIFYTFYAQTFYTYEIKSAVNHLIS